MKNNIQIFKNASFISCEDENKIYSVLIEQNGKIIYLGNHIPDIYLDSSIVDLSGYCVIPAFIDTHIHFESFAFFLTGLDCRNVVNYENLKELIKDHIDNNPLEKTIIGFGISAHCLEEKRLPDRFELDKLTSKAIFIVKYDGHAAIGNSSFIQSLPAKIKNKKGFCEEKGWFFQEAFYNAVNFISKSVSIPALLNSFIKASDYLAKKGIVSVHTAEGVGFPFDMDVDILRIISPGLPQLFKIYFQTMNEKKVTFRRMKQIGGCFKTALDGCFGSEDAAMRNPYSNNKNNNGKLFYSQNQVNNFVSRAHNKGLQIALHAIGDAAIDQAVTAFDYALKKNPVDDHRHIIIHACLTDDETIEKISKSGICLALQCPFLNWPQEPENYLRNIIGDRINNMLPLKNILQAGILSGDGSDAPCTIPDPIMAIYNACNHFITDQRITPLDALKMNTNYAAKLSFDENKRGTLEMGKNADFIVLDKNILEIPVDKIKDIQIKDVYIKGKRYKGQSNSSLSLFFKSIINRF